jgi:hypothetical protein
VAAGARGGGREEGHRGDEEQEDAGGGGHGEVPAVADRILGRIGGRCCRVGGEILLWGMNGRFDSAVATRLVMYRMESSSGNGTAVLQFGPCIV